MSLDQAGTGTPGAAPSPQLPPLHATLPHQLIVSTTDPNALAPILVLPRMATGLGRLEGEGENYKAVSLNGRPVRDFPVQSFAEVMDSEHQDDAHFTTYGANDKDGNLMMRLPRMTKSGVFDFRRDLASDVWGGCIGVDYDLPSHGEWTKETLAQTQILLDEAGRRNPLLRFPSVCYRTAHGLRLVWMLSDPVPLEGQNGFEDILHGMIGDSWRAGFSVDPACKDWTRLFRAPRVVRDGAKTSSQPYFSISFNRIDFSVQEPCPAELFAYSPQAFRPISQHKTTDYEVGDTPKRLVKNYHWDRRIGHAPEARYQTAMNIDVGLPLQDSELVKYLFINGNDKRATALLKAIRHEVLGRGKPGHENADTAVRVFRILFEEEPMFRDVEKKEGLHEAILMVAGFLSSCCNNIPGISPQVIYALTLIQASKANATRPNKRPYEVLSREVWAAVSWFWRRDLSKKAIQEEEKEWGDLQKAVRSAEIAASNDYASTIFLKYLQENSKDTPESVLRAHLQNLLIVLVPSFGYYVMSITSAGEIYFSRPATTYSGLLAVLNRCGHGLIEVFKPSADEDSPPRLKTEPELIQQYGCLADSYKMSRLTRANQISLVGSDISPFTVVLSEKMPGIKRGGIAKFHPEVDEWLVYLGGDDHNKLLDWLAVFPRLERPIAGLYLGKTSGVGKGMLAVALRNWTEVEEHADFTEVMTGFQDTLRKTPFLLAEEYVAVPRFSGKSVLNEFKKAVTGELRTLNLKGKPGVQIDGYWRVLFTANNDNLLNFLEDVTSQDMKAMAVRVIRITPSIKAAEYLEGLGGWKTTKDWPQVNILEHLRWLAQNRPIEEGNRLLVQGENRADAMGMNINSPTGDLILRALAVIFSGKFDRATGFFVGGSHCDALKVDLEKGILYVSSLKMHRVIEEIYGQSRSVKLPSKKTVGDSLHALSSVSSKIVKMCLPKTPQSTIKDWVQVRVCHLDLVEIIKCLDRIGESVDYRQNGFLPNEWYQHNTPEIFAEFPPLPAQAPTPVRSTPNFSAPPAGVHPGFATALSRQMPTKK
jgi:hypothetical protein